MRIVFLLASLAALAVAAPSSGRAQSFDDARKTIDQRLTRSLDELSDVRDRIAKEKVPLSKTVSTLEDEVITLRREHARMLKLRDSRTIDLTSLRRQVESFGEQEEFINSRLNEFVRDFESRLHISELPHYEKKTAAAKLVEKNVNLGQEDKRRAQIEVVMAAIARLQGQLGGHVFAGEALSPEGVLSSGKFVALGPTVFYASDDGSVRGLVESRLNAADPVVVPLPSSLSSGIVTVAADGAGRLPFDATLGKALKVEKARKSVVDHIRDGGVVGAVIVVLGLCALLLTVFKAWEILGFPVAGPRKADGVLAQIAQGNRERAAHLAQDVGGVSGEMLTLGVEHAHEKRSVLEELLFEKILGVRPKLERYLPFLAITAAASPLLGLLGTVVGMIRTFQLITIFGTGDARSLSSGISEALVTTALGLIVAIPTLVMHGALSRMVKRKLGLLEQLSVAFVNGATAVRHGVAPARAAETLPREPRDHRGEFVGDA